MGKIKVTIGRTEIDWHDSYSFHHDGIRGIDEYPIKNEEAFEVVT